jgi:pimeloyl-ACP methyl ester carboxylesterase
MNTVMATHRLRYHTVSAPGEAGEEEPATFRVDRLVSDVESLRIHLGLDRMDLLARFAGAVLATLYAAAYPGHLSRLILVTPGRHPARGRALPVDRRPGGLRRRRRLVPQLTARAGGFGRPGMPPGWLALTRG